MLRGTAYFIKRDAPDQIIRHTVTIHEAHTREEFMAEVRRFGCVEGEGYDVEFGPIGPPWN